MKVDELRGKLYNLEKNDIIRLAVEFYKLVPKTKKEDYNLDELINTPEVKTAKPVAKETVISFEDMEIEVNTFIANAKEQHYLYPNKIISKKERATWRFKVKAWYKELTNPKNGDFNTAKKAKICTDLYDLLCESCHYQYFSADDTFNSVGISQTEFFLSVLQFIAQSEGETALINRGLGMAINNSTSPNTLHSWVMQEFVNALSTTQIKYDAIEKVEKMLEDNKPPIVAKTKKTPYYDESTEKYRRERKTNNLAEMGFRLHASLFEYDEAIQFYNKYATQNDEEIKVYILVNLLFENRQKEYIQSVLETAKASGIGLRSSLNKLLATIEKKGMLPEYF